MSIIGKQICNRIFNKTFNKIFNRINNKTINIMFNKKINKKLVSMIYFRDSSRCYDKACILGLKLAEPGMYL